MGLKWKIPIVLFLVLQTKWSIETEIQLNPLNNPILPIKLGNAKLVYSKHTFLHYIDLIEIITQMENLKSNFLILKGYLKSHNGNNGISYHQLSENLLIRTDNLIHIASGKLQNLIPNNRKKRGLLNIVGQINKWLFGTLDAEDGQHYNEAIATLESSQTSVNEELKLQMSLSKGLITHYNKTITTLNENQDKLRLSIRSFQQLMQQTISNVQNYLGFHGSITQLNLDCQNLIMFLDNLEDAIMFSKLNALHNSILSTNELTIMLKYLENMYKVAAIPKFQNILSYYQFFGTQVSFSHTKIIFAIHVPILRPEDLMFFHLYPIILNRTIFIPQYPYLAQEEVRNQHTSQPCSKIEDTYYCNEEFHPQDDCTNELLKGKTIHNCPTFNIKLVEPIVEQVTEELVLVLLTEPAKLISKCGTDQYHLLETSTLVKIPKNCEIQINEKKFINNINIQKGKPFILPKITLPQTITTKFLDAPNISKINLDEIYHLKEIANQLLPVTLNQKSKHQEYTFFGIVGVCTFLLILLLTSQWNRVRIFWLSTRNAFHKSTDLQVPDDYSATTASKKQSVIFES